MKTWLEVKWGENINYHKSNISMPWEWINIVKYMTERSKQRYVWKVLSLFSWKIRWRYQTLGKKYFNSFPKKWKELCKGIWLYYTTWEKNFNQYAYQNV